jgi:hypothetical protein
MGERYVRNVQVRGSIPLISTRFQRFRKSTCFNGALSNSLRPLFVFLPTEYKSTAGGRLPVCSVYENSAVFCACLRMFICAKFISPINTSLSVLELPCCR